MTQMQALAHDVCLIPLRQRGWEANLLAGCLVFAVILGAAWWMVYRLNPPRFEHWATEPILKRPVRALLPQPRRGRPLRMTRAGGRNPGIMVPIQYSVPDAGFVMRLSIGGGNVLVVIDSGSQSLGVATSECISNQLCSAKDAGYNLNESLSVVRMHRQGKL